MNGKQVGTWVAIGIALGIAVGMATGELAFSMVIGLRWAPAAGAAIGMGRASKGEG